MLFSSLRLDWQSCKRQRHSLPRRINATHFASVTINVEVLLQRNHANGFIRALETVRVTTGKWNFARLLRLPDRLDRRIWHIGARRCYNRERERERRSDSFESHSLVIVVETEQSSILVDGERKPVETLLTGGTTKAFRVIHVTEGLNHLKRNLGDWLGVQRIGSTWSMIRCEQTKHFSIACWKPVN